MTGLIVRCGLISETTTPALALLGSDLFPRWLQSFILLYYAVDPHKVTLFMTESSFAVTGQ